MLRDIKQGTVKTPGAHGAARGTREELEVQLLFRSKKNSI